MNTLVKQSLKQQDSCPACFISWKALDEMLHECQGSDNYCLAQFFLANRHICRERFEK